MARRDGVPAGHRRPRLRRGALRRPLGRPARRRDTLLPLLVLPVLAPVLLAGSKAWEAALDGNAVPVGDPVAESILVPFAAIYFVVGAVVTLRPAPGGGVSEPVPVPDRNLRETFYSALYHAATAPTLYNDADGSYVGVDRKVHERAGFNYYSTFSLWDTYRAEHPLMTLVQPGRVNDFVQSMLAFYQQSEPHALPMWPLACCETRCMIGYHSVPVIVDAYTKGFRGFDAELAFEAMKTTATDCPQPSGPIPEARLRPLRDRQAERGHLPHH